MKMYCFVNHQKNLKFLKIDYNAMVYVGLNIMEKTGHIIEVKWKMIKLKVMVNIETVLEMFIKDNGTKGRKVGKGK